MLLLCSWVSSVWLSCLLKISFSKKNISRIEEWYFRSLEKFRGADIGPVAASTLFSFICWNVWKARNHLVFDGSDLVASQVIRKAVLETLEFSANAYADVKSRIDVCIPDVQQVL